MANQLDLRLIIDEICEQICSVIHEWTDMSVLMDILRRYNLTDKEIKILLDFLLKYFLEVNESGRKIRPIKGFYNLYREYR